MPSIGAELIGGSMYELEPGDRLWPYHTHHANEEWLIVLRGAPTLRTPEGERELAEGDVVCFRRGTEGLHQIRNATDAPMRVLMLSTLRRARHRRVPRLGKVSVIGASRASGSSAAFRGPTPSTGTARTS